MTSLTLKVWINTINTYYCCCFFKKYLYFELVSSTSISPANPEVVAGESLTLTCTATITGRGTPSFTWTGQVCRSPQCGQIVQGNEQYVH